MNVPISVLLDSLEIGSIYAVVIMGMAISFRITGFPDLTMEGSFTTGAAVTAILLNLGVSPLIAILMASIAGSFAGFCTGLLHTKAGISKLLSGIILMTILYTINLRIMGRPNYSLLHIQTILPGDKRSYKLLILFLIVIFVLSVLWWLLKTEFGYFVRATGENPLVVTKSGFNPSTFTIAGLCISNGLTALAGSLQAQDQGFADIGMGVGIIVIALASLLIGESLIRPKTILLLLLAAIVGGWAYQLVLVIGLRIGVGPWDLKLATGILLALAVIFKKKVIHNSGDLNIGSNVL